MRTELTMKPLKDIIDNYQIPELQRLVDNSHIISMVEDQKKEYDKYKTFSMLQSFTIAYIVEEKKGYILDGQHRVEAYSRLKSEGYDIDNILVPIVKYNVGSIEEVNEYFKKNKISWQKSVDDRTYIRRVYLDVTGLNPSPESISAFIADPRSNKREMLVDKLLANNEGYAQHWLTFWNDALRNDYSGTGYITNGRFGITKWLYGSLKTNKPYDTFVKELISPTKESEGFIRGIQWRGTINSSQSTEMQAAQNVSQVLLGLNQFLPRQKR